jgi:hypothetical protein
MRDFLRVVSTNKSTYELKYYNIQVLYYSSDLPLLSPFHNFTDGFLVLCADLCAVGGVQENEDDAGDD